MNIVVKRFSSSFPWEVAKIQIEIEGIGVVHGHTLKKTKDGKGLWLAPPSINSKKGWQNVITLNGSLRQEVTDRAIGMKDNEEVSFNYEASDTALAVYINPYSDNKGLLAMGSLTIKNVLSVNGCTYKKTDKGPILNMPAWYGKNGSSGNYFYLNKRMYAQVQNAAHEAYKIKSAS